MTLPDWAHEISSALDEKMGFELFELSAQRTTGRMPVAGNTQPFGFWHGGASCVLAETLASMAAFAEVGPGGVIFGVDLNATHHRSIRDGWVTARPPRSTSADGSAPGRWRSPTTPVIGSARPG